MGRRSRHRCSSLFFELFFRARVEDRDKHVRDFLPNEWQTPLENIFEIRKPIWVRCAVELSDIHRIILVFQHGSLVVVYVKIIRCREYRDKSWEACVLGFSVHPEASVLGLVRTYDR